jgi:exoribonuclease-2
MRTGLVVGFRDKRDLALACVSEVMSDRVRLVNEKGKEFSFPADKILMDTGRVVTSRVRDDVVAALALARTRIEELRREVALADLWQLRVGTEEEFDVGRLANDYFGEQASGDHRAAMLAELLADSAYFKQKGDAFVARPEDQVQELMRQKVLEELRERQRREALERLAALPDGTAPDPRPPPPPDGADRYVALLRSWVLNAEAAPEQPESAAFLKDLGVGDAAQAFALLVRAGVWGPDENLMLHRYQVPEAFGRDVVAREADVVLTASDPGRFLGRPGREDLTHLAAFTIDDPETEDIDDALTLEVDGAVRRVGIHIADVAEFVADSDPLDAEAFRRGLTLYLPDRRIPMLPPRLSFEVASLVAGGIRPALSVIVDLDEASGAVRSFRVVSSAIRVARRLDYETVDRILAASGGPGEPDAIAQALSGLHAMAGKLRRQRIDAGAMVFNVPDVKIKIEPGGAVSLRKAANDTASHTVVSEMMILANRLVASWLVERKIPAVFRVQAPPDEPVAVVGYDPVAFYRVRRMIKRTEVGTAPRRHHGLGLDAYVQMTSPIRRYADLVAHRQIRSTLSTGRACYSEADIQSIINSTERAADVAGMVQKEAHRYWLLKAAKQLVGLAVPALVLERRDDATVVQLTDSLLEVPVYQRLERRHEVGELILAKIVDVDPRRGSIRCIEGAGGALPDDRRRE